MSHGPGDWLALLVLVGLWLLPPALVFFLWRRYRKTPRPASWMAAFALAGVAWELVRGFLLYQSSMEDHAWTGATILLVLVPLFALWGGLMAAFAGWGVGTVVRGERRPRELVLAAVAFFGGMSVLISEGVHDQQERVARQDERQAGSASITASQVQSIIERWKAHPTDNREARALAANPVLPEAEVRRLAREGDDDMRIAVSRNPKAPSDLLTEFSNSPSEMLRYYVTFNPNTPTPVLDRLSKDASREVSGQAQAAIARRTAQH